MISSSIDEYRSLRREMETGVLPLAGSIDGRAFTLQASLHGLAAKVGGYVMLTGDGAPRLGQVLSMEAVSVDGGEFQLGGEGGGGGRTAIGLRLARGTGVVLDGDGAPFHDALWRPAEPAEIAAWRERSAKPRARLRIGTLALAPGVPLDLDAGGFDRHTFMCGQSGSGKTYSLGVMLEQLLLETRLRIVVLDPNSDYVRMGEVRAGVDAAVAERYRAGVAGLDVHRSQATGENRLRLAMRDLSPALLAALLRLDPVDDREEHAELDAVRAAEQPPTFESFLASERPDARRLVDAGAQPGRRPLRDLGARRPRLHARCAARPGPSRRRRRPRLAVGARRAVPDRRRPCSNRCGHGARSDGRS